MTTEAYTPQWWLYKGPAALGKCELVDTPDGMIEVYGRKKEQAARFISAAPDMFRALELILNSDMAQREEDEGEISTELAHARAAIAKAEGK